MVKKFKWKKHIPDLIWWTVHGSGLKAVSQNDRIRLIKFIHDRLPTNNRKARYEEHTVDRCKACTYTGENDDHIIRCRGSPKRREQRTKWKVELSTFLRGHHTPEPVHDAILGGLMAWLDQKPTPTIDEFVPQASSALRKAYTDQTNIGWRHFVRGRIATEWSTCVRYHLRSNRISAKVMTVERWGAFLTSKNFNHFLQIWDFRNKEEHGDTAESQALISRQKLMTEARLLKHKHRNDISYADRDWFLRSDEQLEGYSISNLMAWVRNARTLIWINKNEQSRMIYNCDRRPSSDPD